MCFLAAKFPGSCYQLNSNDIFLGSQILLLIKFWQSLCVICFGRNIAIDFLVCLWYFPPGITMEFASYNKTEQWLSVKDNLSRKLSPIKQPWWRQIYQTFWRSCTNSTFNTISQLIDCENAKVVAYFICILKVTICYYLKKSVLRTSQKIEALLPGMWNLCIILLSSKLLC